MRLQPQPAEVTECRRLTPDCYSVWLRAPAIARQTGAGQFVQIQISDSLIPFLRRPMSIAQCRDAKIRIVFRRVGAGTERLAQSQRGEYWNLLGPLGRPVSLPEKRVLVLVGGGIGCAPLLLLAEQFIARKKTNRQRLKCLLGARTSRDLLLKKEFRQLGCDLRWATDDGSYRSGIKGPVTELLKKVLAEEPAVTVIACGPRPMLKAVQQICGEVEAYALWEERLGCGTGICYCCAVERADGRGYFRFCQEGPMLNLKAVRL